MEAVRSKAATIRTELEPNNQTNLRMVGLQVLEFLWLEPLSAKICSNTMQDVPNKEATQKNTVLKESLFSGMVVFFMKHSMFDVFLNSMFTFCSNTFA